MPSELEGRLAAVKANLDEALSELAGLPQQLADLRAELEANGFTPAANEFLTSAETTSAALKNLVTTP